MQHRKSIVLSFFHVLAIGLAMQLHFSWPLLAFMSLMLFYRGMIKVSWIGVLLSLTVIVASLVPYLMELMANPDLAHNPDPEARKRYIGWGAVHVFPVVKAALYWLRYGSWSFPSKLVNDTEFLWLGVQFLSVIVSNVWKIVLGIIGAVTVVVAAIANWTVFCAIRHLIRRRSDTALQPHQWLMLYAFAAFVAALISAALSPIVFNYWHLTLIFPFALFPIVFWADKYLKYSLVANPRGLVWVFAFFLVVNVVALNDSRKFSYKADYAEQTLRYVQEHVGARQK